MTDMTTTTSTPKYSAKDFQAPVLRQMHALAQGTTSTVLNLDDLYQPVIDEMGIPALDAFGNAPDGTKTQVAQWIQWALKNLKRTGHVESVSRGKWLITAVGVAEVEGKAPQPIQTPDDTVSSPVSPGYEDDETYNADPYIRALAAKATPCYGHYSHKSATCDRCPLQGPCINFLAAQLSSLAAVLQSEDKAARLKQQAPAPPPQVIPAAVAPVNPAVSNKAAGDFDWSEWNIAKMRKIVVKAEAAKCPVCNEVIPKDSDALWLSAVGTGAGGRKKARMFHNECGPPRT